MNCWIQSIEEAQAEGELNRLYEEIKVKRGSVSNVMKAQSLDPESMKLHLDLYLHLMFGRSTLNRLEREMIAVVVSHLNNCSYCVTHHSEALLHHSKNPSLQGELERHAFDQFRRRTVRCSNTRLNLQSIPSKCSRPI
jgi:uncharacterized peroxidase-related enzyme